MIFGLMPVFLRPIMAPEAQWIAYGGVLIVILFVLPRGIVPSVAQRFANRRNRASAVAFAERDAKEHAWWRPR
jgi:branched-chain amino acid transport system permease protein